MGAEKNGYEVLQTIFSSFRSRLLMGHLEKMGINNGRMEKFMYILLCWRGLFQFFLLHMCQSSTSAMQTTWLESTPTIRSGALINLSIFLFLGNSDKCMSSMAVQNFSEKYPSICL